MKQFNWRKNWPNVSKYLNDTDVQFALDIGMIILNNNWKHGDAPYLEGAISCTRIVKNKLSWYQPLNRCHWIAPFSCAVGIKLYPELTLGFLTSDSHTIAIGTTYKDSKESAIDIVMDILLFDSMSAKESIAHVNKCESRYAANIQELFVTK